MILAMVVWLSAWEINQMTKPDFADGPAWNYSFQTACAPSELICDPFPDIEDDERVRDLFFKDTVRLYWNHEESIPVDEDMANILGHIVPSRTGALGQRAERGLNSVINEETPLPFGVSNQGHSAQYYNTFLSRCQYWGNLLVEFLKDKEFKFENECQF